MTEQPSATAANRSWREFFVLWVNLWMPLFRSRAALVEALRRQVAIAAVRAAVAEEEAKSGPPSEQFTATAPRPAVSLPIELSDLTCNRWVLANRLLAGWAFAWLVVLPLGLLALTILTWPGLVDPKPATTADRIGLAVGISICFLIELSLSFWAWILVTAPLTHLWNHFMKSSAVSDDGKKSDS
jgi:hypothetical protein